jgi:hypothetical protein
MNDSRSLSDTRVATFTARKALFGEGIPVEELDLWYVAEQQPNPQSRVMLGRTAMLSACAEWPWIGG